MKIYLLLILMTFCFPACLLFGYFKCPSTSERRLRGKWFSQKYGLKEENYACLYDEIVNAYQETCIFHADILDPGELYVINHRPKSVKCKNVNRYQPFGLQNFTHECLYHRSMCSESGQVRFHEGSSTIDKTCRCNFDEGYAFVSTPAKRCYCTPSTEDCSCYLQKCPDNHKIASDYKCTHVSNKSYVPPCPDMDNKERSSLNKTMFKGTVQHSVVKGPKYNRIVPAIAIFVCVIFILIICGLLVLDKMPPSCYKTILLPILQTYSSDGQLKLFWTNIQVKEYDALQLKIMYTHNDWKETECIDIVKSQSFCIIPNVLPEKTYRFTIQCGRINSSEGNTSGETIFNSGTPDPPNCLQVGLLNGQLRLTWTFPVEGLFRTKSYKIYYTYNDWGDTKECFVKPDESAYVIPNILPEKGYKFKIASCLDNSYEGKPSAETYFYTGSPHPPAELATFPQNGVLTLTWTSPEKELFEVEYYLIEYTSNEWKDKKHIQVNATESSWILQNVFPLRTYRFTIASCLTNCHGKPSREHMFHSGRPNEPSSLETVLEDGNIKILWTSPAEIEFKTESYHLEVTNDDFKTTKSVSIPVDELEYVFKDFAVDATYRIKLFSVSKSEKSLPAQAICIASPRMYVKLHINGINPTDSLRDKTSYEYKMYKDIHTNAIKEVYQETPGTQQSTELDFIHGSLFAVFILISKGYYDEAKLKNAFEKKIKTGTFGYFKVSMKGFVFQALDNPVPPQFHCVHTIDNVIHISWSKPAKTFFKTTNFLLQSTTDDWKTHQEYLISAYQYHYYIPNVVPSTKYTFKISTIVQNGLQSVHSKEVYTVTKGAHFKLLNVWKKEDELYHDETSLYQTIQFMVDSCSIVGLVGGPGCGKTASARHVALKYEQNGWEIIPVLTFEELLQYPNLKPKKMFVLDDIFGTFALDMFKYSSLNNHKTDIMNVTSMESKLLFTCRRSVYNEANMLNSFVLKDIVDFESKENTFNSDEKELILKKHCRYRGVPEVIYSDISLPLSIEMFPLNCNLLSAKYDIFDFVKFFAMPIDCLILELDQLKSKFHYHYSALVMCVLGNNNVTFKSMLIKDIKTDVYSTCGLNLGSPAIQIQNALLDLEETFLRKFEDDFTFINDTMFEIVAYHYGKHYPRTILKYMKSNFIAARVSVYKDNGVDLSTDLIIVLHNDQYEEMAQRLYTDLQSLELFDVFLNKSLHSSSFLEVFIQILRQKPYKELMTLLVQEQNDFKFRVIYSDKDVTIEDEYEENERQRLLMNVTYHSDNTQSKVTTSIKVISWIIYYGHTHLLQSIVDIVLENHDSTELVFGSTITEQTRLLTLGCYSGDHAMVNLILKYVNNECINTTSLTKYRSTYYNKYNNHRKRTAFTAACYSGHISVVKLLIEHAKINLCDANGCFPLLAAFIKGHYDVVNYLVKMGAAVNHFDEEKWSSLYEASKGGHIDVLKYLLKTELMSTNVVQKSAYRYINIRRKTY